MSAEVTVLLSQAKGLLDPGNHRVPGKARIVETGWRAGLNRGPKELSPHHRNGGAVQGLL